MAIASPNISAVTVEATEFPDLARQFSVQGVPRTVVNRGGAFVGALPEQQFVAAVLDLAGVNGHAEAETAAEADAPQELGSETEPGADAGSESADARDTPPPVSDDVEPEEGGKSGDQSASDGTSDSERGRR
jgi:thioredoxin-like negative regulator of GroEL